MLPPAHIDGLSLVVLRRRHGVRPFSVIESGRLEHDGATLTMVGNQSVRVLSEQDIAEIRFVRPDTRIQETRDFDLFLIVES